MTIQRTPIPVGPCFDVFVLKFASLGASSTPSPLMLDRWAAFKRATGQYLLSEITSLRSYAFKNFQNFLTKPVIHYRRRMASGRCKDYDQSLVQLGAERLLEECCRLAPDDIVA